MDVLIGTTNPSKIERFKTLLDGCGITFYTLKDLQIDQEPEEKGNTPEENAILKAKFYGRYFDRVICNDAGLYFDGLPLDDDRQPGLHVRTPAGSRRLDDEEMISYYTGLIRRLGGRVSAYYLDGIAVYNRGEITSFLENAEEVKDATFYMIDQPSSKRQPGWPLDSISLDRQTMTYFVDEEEQDDFSGDSIIAGEYRKRLVDFLKQSLGAGDAAVPNSDSANT